MTFCYHQALKGWKIKVLLFYLFIISIDIWHGHNYSNYALMHSFLVVVAETNSSCLFTHNFQTQEKFCLLLCNHIFEVYIAFYSHCEVNSFIVFLIPVSIFIKWKLLLTGVLQNGYFEQPTLYSTFSKVAKMKLIASLKIEFMLRYIFRTKSNI